MRTTAQRLQEKGLGLLFSYIQISVTDNSRPEYLASIHRQYCQFLDTVVSETIVEVCLVVVDNS